MPRAKLQGKKEEPLVKGQGPCLGHSRAAKVVAKIKPMKVKGLEALRLW